MFTNTTSHCQKKWFLVITWRGADIPWPIWIIQYFLNNLYAKKCYNSAIYVSFKNQLDTKNDFQINNHKSQFRLFLVFSFLLSFSIMTHGRIDFGRSNKYPQLWTIDLVTNIEKQAVNSNQGNLQRRLLFFLKN